VGETWMQGGRYDIVHDYIRENDFPEVYKVMHQTCTAQVRQSSQLLLI
jgi:gamma-glutamylcysteine synthetase